MNASAAPSVETRTMRAKIAVVLGLAVVVAIAIWVAASRRKTDATPAQPQIVSSLVTSEPSSAPAPAAEAGPAYTGGFRSAMERHSRVAISKGTKLAGRALENLLPEPTCVDGELGGWALRVDDAFAVSSEYMSGQTDIGFEVVLVHRDAAGALSTYALPHDTWHPDGGPSLDVAISLIDYYGSRSIHTLVVGDIDGNRDPEIFLAGGIHEEGPDPGWTLLLSFKDGAIGPYAGAKDVDVNGVEDVDHDGRLDLLTSGRYSGIEANSQIGSSYPVIEGLFVAHTLSDGGFSMTDSVAKAALKKTCPKKEPISLPPDTEWVEPTDAAKQVLCARAWGASEADVLKQMKARCTKYDPGPTDVAQCPELLLYTAKVVPEVRLDQ
jgi:hypothetical protein